MPSEPPSEPMPSSGNGRDDAGLSPSAAPPIDPVEEFVSLNREPIARLATFIDFAEGFTIGFVEINFLADLNILIRQLAQHPDCQEAQFIEFDLGDPNLRFLKDELLNRLQATHLEPDKKPVLWLKGLEQSIGMSGEYPPMLADLNFVRDAYTDQVPYLVLFCLPDYAVNRVIKFAPDFWSWGSGVFRFQTRPSTQQQAADNTIFSDRIRGSLQIADWQQRIDQLERLAMEYRPSSDPSREALENWCRVLMELGIAYDEQGETAKGEYYLQQALAVADGVEALQRQKGLLLHELGIICRDTGRVQAAEALFIESISIKELLGGDLNKAATLHELGRLKANQGEIDEAIALYQQSLDITEKIGDVQTQAATLHELGSLKANQGEIDEAIALYQQSLDITKQIGDVQGQAATLHELGSLKANQGEIDEAIALYQQSLDIKERIGDVQGQAVTLHQLGILKANQGEIEAAIALYQQSLDITKQIGNVQGQAATLHCLGILKADQGEIDEAIALYQQSLDIAKKVGDVQGQAATLHNLGSLKADQGEIDEAIALYQQSLDITKQIGNVQGQASTLHCLGILKADQGEIEAAIQLFEESVRIKRQIGYLPGLPPTLAWLARIAEQQGDIAQAEAYLQEALAIAQRVGSPDAASYQSRLARLHPPQSRPKSRGR